MEGYNIIKPIDFDRSALYEEKLESDKVIKSVVYQAAVRYQWQTLRGTADDFLIRNYDEEAFYADPLSKIWTASFMRPNETFGLDVLMVHFYVNHGTKTWDVDAYVFPRPKVNSYGHEYFEHGGFRIFEKDSCIIFEEYETYADCADIHDHDHYTLSAQVIFDKNTRTLYYPKN